MPRSPFAHLVSAMAVALSLVGGCGDGDDEPSGTGTTAEVTTTAGATTTVPRTASCDEDALLAAVRVDGGPAWTSARIVACRDGYAHYWSQRTEGDVGQWFAHDVDGTWEIVDGGTALDCDDLARPPAEPAPYLDVCAALASVDDPLSDGRLGPIMLGMTLAEVEAATGHTLRVEPYEDRSCLAATLDGLDDVTLYGGPPPDDEFPFDHEPSEGVVKAIVVSGDRPTEDGLRVGDPEALVAETYPGLEISENPYGGSVYGPPDALTRQDLYPSILVATDGEQVTMIATGYLPLEGCA